MKSQRGQAAIEYLGLTVVAALLVLALIAASGEIRTAASDALARAVCMLEGQGAGDCGGSSADESVVPLGSDVDPDAPRPDLSEASDATAPTTLAVATPGAGETCFASSNGCEGPDDAPDGAIVPPPDPEVCDEGAEVGPDQVLKCDVHGLPILDLDYDGVNDFEDPYYTTENGEELPWYEQGYTDFNENGVPDADEPEAFSYAINRLYRPGAEGVYCEPSPEVEGQLNCAPAPELFGRVTREQNSSLLGILERASWFVPIPGGILAKAASKLAGPIIKGATGKAKSAVDVVRNLLSKLRRAPAGSAARLPDDVVRLTRSHLTDSGETVIGHYSVRGYPPYTEAARRRGASYFDLGKRYDELTEAQQKAANQLFLDDIVAKGDRVTISHPRSLVRRDSPLEWELRYLESKGYRQIDSTTLVPP